MSNLSTSSWTARPDDSGRWNNWIAASHLPRDLGRPSSEQQQLVQTTKKTCQTSLFTLEIVTPSNHSHIRKIESRWSSKRFCILYVINTSMKWSVPHMFSSLTARIYHWQLPSAPVSPVFSNSCGWNHAYDLPWATKRLQVYSVSQTCFTWKESLLRNCQRFCSQKSRRSPSSATGCCTINCCC